MRQAGGRFVVLASLFCFLFGGSILLAEEQSLRTADSTSSRSGRTSPMSFAPFAQEEETGGTTEMESETETTTETTETTTVETRSESGFRGVNDFFNIREANSDVTAGEWEFMIGSAWSTFHSRKNRDDDLTVTPSVKYGITDDLFTELELLPVNFGDGLNLPDSNGADGTGDVALKLFWQFLHEDGSLPAMAIWSEARLPTGENSEKIDGTLNLNLTKTISGPLRAHFQGFIQTANGARGDWDREEFGDRRHFQWGLGSGLDYAIDECNMIVFNYLNRSSELYGSTNNNLLELGYVYRINECSYLRAAVDTELQAEADGPHWTAKVQYAYSLGGS